MNTNTCRRAQTISKAAILVIVMGFVACETQSEIVPEPQISISSTRYLQQYPINFTASSVTDANLDKYTIAWDFGDGSTGIGLIQSHTYDSPSTYDIELRISGESSSESAFRTIEVHSSLALLQSYTLPVESPSGLSFGLDHLSLWTVSDKPNGRIVNLDLHGNLIRELPYLGDDLEGICFDTRDSSLWVIDELMAQLVHLDTNGTVLESQLISSVSDGSGLEGIALDPLNKRIFLLKEKDFSAFLILDEQLNTELYQRITFAPDYSGMDYYPSVNLLWMLSDEASSVYLTDTGGNLISSYGFFMEQPEGLVFDEADSTFYIVDDTTEKLHLYRFWN